MIIAGCICICKVVSYRSVIMTRGAEEPGLADFLSPGQTDSQVEAQVCKTGAGHVSSRTDWNHWKHIPFWNMMIDSARTKKSEALVKRTRKSTQVSTCVQLAFGLATHLHWLAWTLVELKFVRKSAQLFHRLATQRRSTQVDRKSTVYAWNLRLFATCESVWPRTCDGWSTRQLVGTRWITRPTLSTHLWTNLSMGRFYSTMEY